MTNVPKLVLLVIHVLLCWAFTGLCFGDEPKATMSEIEKYEAQINYVIRTRLDEEKAYVHEVVDLVRRGQLPRKLVDKSVSWVHDHCNNDEYGFVYFEKVLRRQAGRLQFKVPAFDYRVYDTSNLNSLGR